nr:MAG TPA: hypothetical protein [Caudoviricetes sp.]
MSNHFTKNHLYVVRRNQKQLVNVSFNNITLAYK